MDWSDQYVLLREGGYGDAEIQGEKQRQYNLLKEGGYDDEKIKSYFGEGRGLVEPVPQERGWGEFFQSAGADVGKGVQEAPGAVMSGVLDAHTGMVEGVGFIMGLKAPSELPAESGGVSIDLKTGATSALAPETPNKEYIDYLKELSEGSKPTSVTGTLIQQAARFSAAFMTIAGGLEVAGVGGAGALLGTAGKVAETSLTAGAAGFLAMEPYEGNIANTIEALDPGLKDSWFTFLATDPNDGEGMARFKNAVAEAGFGAVAEGLLIAAGAGLRQIKALRKSYQTVRVEDEINASIDVGGDRFRRVAQDNMTRRSSDTGEPLHKIAADARRDPSIREDLLVENPIFRDSVIRTADGQLEKVYSGYARGTVTDMSRQRMDPQALYGPGIYTTVDPEIASSYTANKLGGTDFAHTPTVEELRAFYKPGEIVDGIGGAKDKVLGFHETKGGNWFVEVQAISPTSHTPLGSPRTHSTVPRAQSLADKKIISEPAGPNVAPSHLNLKNPLKIEESYASAEVTKLVENLPDRYKGQIKLPEAEKFTGKDIYNLLEDAFGGSKKAVNKFLEEQGYDGIAHIGGQIMGKGGKLHQVYVAFDPANVKGAFLEPAYIPLGKAKPLNNLGPVGREENMVTAAMSRDPDLKKVLADFAASESGELKVPTLADVAEARNNIHEQIVDDRDPLYLLTKGYAENNPKLLRRALQTDNLVTLLNGTYGRAKYFWEEGVHLANGKKVGPALYRIAEKTSRAIREELTAQGNDATLAISASAQHVKKQLLENYQGLIQYAEEGALVPKGSHLKVTSLPENTGDPMEFLRVETLRLARAVEGNKARLALANLVADEVPLKRAPNLVYPKSGTGEAPSGVRPSIGHTYEKAQAVLTAANKNDMLVVVDGAHYRLDIGEDIVKSFHTLAAQDMDIIERTMGLGGKLVRLAVNKNPFFQIAQMAKDEVWQAITREDPAFPFHEVFVGLRDMFGFDRSVHSAYKRMGSDTASLNKFLERNFKNPLPDPKSVGLYGVLRNVIHFPNDALSMIADVTFHAGRVGQFSRALKKGTVIEDAAVQAREGRMDMQRMGSATRRRNGMIAFLGVAINDIERIGAAFKSRPVQTTLVASMALTLPGIASWAMYKDEDWYKAAPEWQKDMAIPITKDFWVPVPQILGQIFVGLPRAILEDVVNDNPAAMESILARVLASTMPPFLPDAAKPIMEHAFNFNVRTGGPLMSDSVRNRLPPERYTAYTSESAKEASRYIYDTTGMGMAPVAIDNYIKSWTGKFGEQALKWSDDALVASGAIEDPVKPSEGLEGNPFFRSYMARNPSLNDARISRFYDRMREHDELMGSLRQLKKEMVLGAQGDRYIKMLEENAQDLADLGGMKKALDNQRQMADNIYLNRSINPDEKRQLLDLLYGTMAQTAENGNLLMDILDMVKDGTAK